jgi:hypothetical protein
MFWPQVSKFELAFYVQSVNLENHRRFIFRGDETQLAHDVTRAFQLAKFTIFALGTHVGRSWWAKWSYFQVTIRLAQNTLTNRRIEWCSVVKHLLVWVVTLTTIFV